MPNFGTQSENLLSTVHSDLVRVCRGGIRIYDFKVLEGHRGEELQNHYFDIEQSQKRFPDGKHNGVPSEAVDIAPYPIDWKDLSRFHFLAGVMFAVADSLGILLRWGGDWNSNMDFTDQDFFDLPHFEIIGI